MMRALKIRPATEAELPTARALLAETYSRYSGAMTPAIWRIYLADLLPDERLLPYLLVGEADGVVVATVRLYPPGAAEVPLPAEVGYLRGVAVRPDWEGRGLARALVAECERRIAALGAATVMLHTTEFMPRAVRLYRGLGYRRDRSWDIRADDHYELPEPSGLVAHAYRRDLDNT